MATRAGDAVNSDPDAEVGRALVDEALAHAELARVELRELVQGMLSRVLGDRPYPRVGGGRWRAPASSLRRGRVRQPAVSYNRRAEGQARPDVERGPRLGC